MSMSVFEVNDVFKFDFYGDVPLMRTWTFEGLLIVCRDNNGNLVFRDMYYNISGKNGASFSESEAIAKGSLDFYCNMDNIELVVSDEAALYDDEDIFILHTYHRHGEVHRYKRKGAEKNKEKMLAIYSDRIVEIKNQINRLNDDLKCYANKKASIERDIIIDKEFNK